MIKNPKFVKFIDELINSKSDIVLYSVDNDGNEIYKWNEKLGLYELSHYSYSHSVCKYCGYVSGCDCEEFATFSQSEIRNVLLGWLYPKDFKILMSLKEEERVGWVIDTIKQKHIGYAVFPNSIEDFIARYGGIKSFFCLDSKGYKGHDCYILADDNQNGEYGVFIES